LPRPILLGGSEEQKQEYLPKIIGGDWAPYTAALIELSFDFDPNALKTTAKAKADDYVLNGEKFSSHSQKTPKRSSSTRISMASLKASSSPERGGWVYPSLKNAKN
jgi:hypothetical protein